MSMHLSAELELFHEKIAATRQVKEIKKRLDAGDLQGARNLSQKLLDGGYLKVTELGSQLRQLGAGREGVAFLVVGAKDAPVEAAVRKMYDPSAAVYNPANPDLKVQLGQELNNNPAFAKMYTKDKARRAGNIPYHLGEYVPGQDLGEANLSSAQLNQHVDALENTVQSANKKLPVNVGDVVSRDILGRKVFNAGNARVTPDGTVKIIDYLPQNRKGYAAKGDYINAAKAQPHFDAYDAAHREAQFAFDAQKKKSLQRKMEQIDADHLKAKPKNVFAGMQQEAKIKREAEAAAAAKKVVGGQGRNAKNVVTTNRKPLLLGAAALAALGLGGLAYADAKQKKSKKR